MIWTILIIYEYSLMSLFGVACQKGTNFLLNDFDFALSV